MDEITKLIITFQSIYKLTNLISFTLSIILFLFIFSTRVLKFKASSRLNYKLYLWTMLIDIINHLPFQFNWKALLLPCKIYMFVNYWINLISVLLIAALAYNIHMVFLISKPIKVKTELESLLWVLSLASITSIPFLIVLILSKDCYDPIRYIGLLGVLKMLGLIGITYFILTTYCLVVFVLVVKKLLSHKIMVNSRNPLTSKYMKRLVFRLCLYPLIPVIIWYPHIISSTIEALSKEKYAVYVVGIQGVIVTLQGSLNFLFFLFDPALNEIYKEAKYKWFKNKKDYSINLDKLNNEEINTEEIELVYNLEESTSDNNKFKIV